MPESCGNLTILAFDFGMKRIGVAIGQKITQHARPLTTIPATDGIPKWSDIKALITKWQVNQLIVGLPLNLDGSDQEITLAAKKFSRRLRAKFNLPVALVDERYSTKHARSSTNFHRDEKAKIDSCAAAVILETWLRQDCN